jgi:molecular chaperone DnaK
MVYQVEKMLKDHRDKISPEDAANVESALEGARKAMSGGSVEDINKAVDNLTSASHKLAEAMYKASSTTGAQGAAQGDAQGAGASGDGGGQQKPKDNVVDAEFVDVDENKK